MSELYWIMVLDNLCFVASITMIVSGLISAGSWVISVICWSEADGEADDDDSDWRSYRKAKNVASKSFTACIIATAISMFTPSKEQMYMIVGVGTAIDYVQQNEKAKQLPDKCIDALSRWVDSLNKDSVEESK